MTYLLPRIVSNSISWTAAVALKQLHSAFQLDTKLISCATYLCCFGQARFGVSISTSQRSLGREMCSQATPDRPGQPHTLHSYASRSTLSALRLREWLGNHFAKKPNTSKQCGEVFWKRKKNEALNHEWNLVKRRKEFLSVTQFLLLL